MFLITEALVFNRPSFASSLIGQCDHGVASHGQIGHPGKVDDLAVVVIGQAIERAEAEPLVLQSHTQLSR